jgi:hypothetical protein
VLPKLPEIAAFSSKPGQVGTLGTPFQNPRATGAVVMNHDNMHKETHTHKDEKTASQASHGVPTCDLGCEPCGKSNTTDYADIDLETGYPIIDGAICPF